MYNGDLVAVVAVHGKRLDNLEEDGKTTLARLEFEAADGEREHKALTESIAKIDRKLDQLLTRKKVTIGLVLGAIGILGAGIPAATWVMNANTRNLLMEMHVLEMRRIP